MNPRAHTPEQIISAAHEAQAWCTLRWNAKAPRESLRPYEFAPQLFADAYSMIQDVIIQRRAELGKLGSSSMSSELSGEFLAFQPDVSMADCLPEQETEGFFDSYDCPPWGLWVGYESRHLICWIPERLRAIVDKGMAVSGCDPWRWLNAINEPWVEAIRLHNKPLKERPRAKHAAL